jgi:hypothetical protein
MMVRFGGVLLKLVLLAVVWFTTIVVAHYSSIGLSYDYALGNITGSLVTAMIIAFIVIAGLMFTERIFGLFLRLSPRDEILKPRKAAAVEPETLRLRDMISILDEDDLDDLRAEVREGLRDRIRNLTADESESFEDLLADAGTKRKRGAR